MAFDSDDPTMRSLAVQVLMESGTVLFDGRSLIRCLAVNLFLRASRKAQCCDYLLECSLDCSREALNIRRFRYLERNTAKNLNDIAISRTGY